MTTYINGKIVKKEKQINHNIQ